MPPEYLSRRSLLHHPRSIFFSLLRPELVQSHGAPLCPDAFSGFMAICESEEETTRLNKAVYLASKKLHSQIIPAFARDLSLKFSGHVRAMGSRVVIERALEDLKWLCLEMHRRGINFRHYGEVRQLVPEKFQYLRLLIVTEMGAR